MSTLVSPLNAATEMSDNLRGSFVAPSWLEDIANREYVRDTLVQHIPELASEEMKLKHCKLKLRIRDEQGIWTGTCLLTIEGEEPEQMQLIPLQATFTPPTIAEPGIAVCKGVFGSEEWFCYIPELCLALETQELDMGLPGLSRLTDAEKARELLEVQISKGSDKYNDFHIQTCTPHVVRYKPNSRCTILYDLVYDREFTADPSWPELVVAKTYHGSKGANAYEAMQALWRSPLRTSSAVSIAEPLAYIPEINVLIQGPIREETTLQEFVQSVAAKSTPGNLEELNQYVRKTAIGLAKLHQSGVTVGESYSWETELSDVYRRQARTAVPIPQLANAVTPLLKHLEQLAVDCPADPKKPAHGSFRAAQVLLNQKELGFIDFDSFCQAEPARDLAEFTKTFKYIAVGKTSGSRSNMPTAPQVRLARWNQMVAICEMFLVEYENHAPVTRQRIVLWETLNFLMLLFGCWTKVKPQRIDNCLFMLDQHLQGNNLPLLRS